MIGSTLWLLFQQDEAEAETPALDLSAVVAAGPQVNLSWVATAIVGETVFSIERRDTTAGGSFAEIATVGANVYSYTGDAGPFTAKHRYAWRVVVSGGASDGLVSNEVALFGGLSFSGRLRRIRRA